MARIQKAINEATNYSQIRDITKQVATDLTGFLLNNKYRESALTKKFIEEALRCQKEGDCRSGNRESGAQAAIKPLIFARTE